MHAYIISTAIRDFLEELSKNPGRARTKQTLPTIQTAALHSIICPTLVIYKYYSCTIAMQLAMDMLALDSVIAFTSCLMDCKASDMKAIQTDNLFISKNNDRLEHL